MLWCNGMCIVYDMYLCMVCICLCVWFIWLCIYLCMCFVYGGHLCVYVCVYAHMSTFLKLGLGAREVAYLESDALNIDESLISTPCTR